MAPVAICSADSFFVVDGEYKFNPSQLPAAHAKCLRDFVSWVQDAGVGKVRKVTILRGIPGSGKSTYIQGHAVGDVVVDNTSTTVAEIAPYAALALAYGAELEIVTLDVAPEVAAARNVHGVPLDGCKRMAARIREENNRLPPWWNHRVLVPGPDRTWTTAPKR